MAARLTHFCQAERSRLENALRHLDASNAELREALARDGPDQARPALVQHARPRAGADERARLTQDYEDALRENVDVMSGMLAKASHRKERRVGLLDA